MNCITAKPNNPNKGVENKRLGGGCDCPNSINPPARGKNNPARFDRAKQKNELASSNNIFT